MGEVEAKQRSAKMRDRLKKSDRHKKNTLEVSGYQFQLLRFLELHEFLQLFLSFCDESQYPSNKLLKLLRVRILWDLRAPALWDT